jgi:hypothetical protein
MVEGKLGALPPALRAQAHQTFVSFMGRAREAFAASITETFLIAAVLMGVAFVISTFLKEIPLRKSHAQRPGEAATEPGLPRDVFPVRDEPGVP